MAGRAGQSTPKAPLTCVTDRLRFRLKFGRQDELWVPPVPPTQRILTSALAGHHTNAVLAMQRHVFVDGDTGGDPISNDDRELDI